MAEVETNLIKQGLNGNLLVLNISKTKFVTLSTQSRNEILQTLYILLFIKKNIDKFNCMQYWKSRHNHIFLNIYRWTHTVKQIIIYIYNEFRKTINTFKLLKEINTLENYVLCHFYSTINYEICAYGATYIKHFQLHKNIFWK